ncbi:MAG: hypothetical protein SGILL_008433, partial [Bacillariaceae sp.]
SSSASIAGQKRPASSVSTPSSAPGTPGTPSKSGKKRPYRRTKRPLGYNDRSTVTTVTPKAASEGAAINEYDLVMAEAEDLLNASMQAQKMGRLKMASAYQLLLHTRLVGLGKRVDRSILPAGAMPRQLQRQRSREMAGDNNLQRPTMASRLAAASEDDDKKPAAKEGPNEDDPNSKAPPNSQEEEKQVLPKLASILPQDSSMDDSIAEHLAKASSELHHQRTGRRRTSDGLLANTNTFNALVAMKHAAQQPPPNPPPPPPTWAEIKAANKTWSQAEIDIVNKGIQKRWQPETIAKILSNKNETQVREFLSSRNITIQPSTTMEPPKPPPPPPKPTSVMSAARNKTKPTRSVPNAAGGGASASLSTQAAAASITQNVTGDYKSSSTPRKGGYPAGVPEVVAASVVGGIPLDAASPGRNNKGGRGRKPVTTAMNTVATVSLDVKSLLNSSKHDGDK